MGEAPSKNASHPPPPPPPPTHSTNTSGAPPPPPPPLPSNILSNASGVPPPPPPPKVACPPKQKKYCKSTAIRPSSKGEQIIASSQARANKKQQEISSEYYFHAEIKPTEKTESFFSTPSGDIDTCKNYLQHINDFKISEEGSSGVVFVKYTEKEPSESNTNNIGIKDKVNDDNDADKNDKGDAAADDNDGDAGNGQDRVLVLKASQSLACDYFASLVVSGCGLLSPKCAILNYSSEEFGWTAKRLKELSFQQAHRCKIRRLLQTPFFMIMEFMSGDDLFKLASTGNLPQLLATYKPQESGWEKNDILFSIGHTIAIDILINNWDRFPIIWDNDGNLCNVVISPDGQLQGIDPCYTPLASGFKGAKNYLTSVDDLLKSVLTKKVGDIKEFVKLQKQFVDYLGFNIGNRGIMSIREGFIHGVKKCLEFGYTGFVETVEKLKTSVEDDWNDIWAIGCDSINLELFKEVLDKFQEFYDRYTQSYNKKLNMELDERSSPVQLAQANVRESMKETCLSLEKVLKDKSCDIVILPENCFSDLSKPLLVDEIPNVLKDLLEVVSRYKIYLIIGSILEKENKTNDVYETSIVIGPDGRPISKYRKQKCEKNTNGSSPFVIEFGDLGRFGILLGEEVNDPLLFKTTKHLRPNYIFNPNMKVDKQDIEKSQADKHFTYWTIEKKDFIS